MTRSYKELSHLKSFEERYNYLKLRGIVGVSTFGFDRYLNQIIYRSGKWLSARDSVIIRDKACDLGIDGYDIFDHVIIHHMNPLTIQQVQNGDEIIFDPEFLVCTSHRTHMAIHYGDESLLYKKPIVRQPGDTIPWFKP